MNNVKMIMLAGLPASGKSCKAQKLAKEYNAEILNSDDLRIEMFGDINHQDNNHELFNELHRRIKECLRSGKSAIYDATNINYKRRMAFLQELTNIQCEKICVLMATPYEECLRRNSERERKVPEEVIKNMYMNFNVPYWYEGWDDIQVCYSDDAEKSTDIFYNIYFKNKMHSIWSYNQNNSHHTMTLGRHLYEVYNHVKRNNRENDFNAELEQAAALHDMSKPFCASFKNSKGEISDECHYYNHQYCSAYDSLFEKIIYNVDKLTVAAIIMWHMLPYVWEEDDNEKMRKKYKKLWGEKLYNDIILLHQIDKNCH